CWPVRSSASNPWRPVSRPWNKGANRQTPANRPTIKGFSQFLSGLLRPRDRLFGWMPFPVCRGGPAERHGASKEEAGFAHAGCACRTRMIANARSDKRPDPASPGFAKPTEYRHAQDEEQKRRFQALQGARQWFHQADRKSVV